MTGGELQERIDNLYDEVKSHTRSCECDDCYEYERLMREQQQQVRIRTAWGCSGTGIHAVDCRYAAMEGVTHE